MNDASNDQFSITGYGNLDPSCSNTRYDGCDIILCGTNHELEVNALATGSSDPWDMVLSGDISDAVISWDLLSKLEHNWVPVFMSGTDYTRRKFQLQKRPQCYTIRFSTLHDNYGDSSDRFVVRGYGDIPAACKQWKGSNCKLTICGETFFEITAEGPSGNGWAVDLYGN